MSSPPSSAADQWNARFAGADYAYGTQPNDFLVEAAARLPPGARVLSLGEGEGRNAVYLAGLGHRVTAVDASSVGLQKAQRLAAERGVALETRVSDLRDAPLEPGAWDAVVSIFCHLPPEVEAKDHRGYSFCSMSARPDQEGLAARERVTETEARSR